jgi:uncharacterized protein YutE (UPF0331/DUF86 family)
MDKKLLNKIDTLKDFYEELKEQYEIYNTIDEKYKKTAILALQKKSEEIIEHSIKVNRELLKKKNIFAISYQDSFLKLSKFGFEENLVKKFTSFALFRNKLAHEYLEITDEESMKYVDELIEKYPEYLKKILETIKNI